MSSNNVKYWASLMRERTIPVPPDPVRIDTPLADGQHRLKLRPLSGEELDRVNKGWDFHRRMVCDGWLWRRRIVRVATLKYRARKRRR